MALPSLLALGHLLDLLLSCSEFLFISSTFLGVRRLVRTLLVLPLLATLLAHVRSMRLALRLHAVFSSALVPSTSYTLTLSMRSCYLLRRCGCLLLL